MRSIELSAKLSLAYTNSRSSFEGPPEADSIDMVAPPGKDGHEAFPKLGSPVDSRPCQAQTGLDNGFGERESIDNGPAKVVFDSESPRAPTRGLLPFRPLDTSKWLD
jgi:hypothetical protein